MPTDFTSRVPKAGEASGVPAPCGLEAENAALRAEVDRLQNDAVERWLTRALVEGHRIREFENSLSWRVTRPLRVARQGLLAVRRMGPVAVGRIAISRVRSRRG